jgi:putative peptidoglycan lipid II flippase
MSQDSGLLRSSSVMAAGTVTSRVTGLVKNSVLLAAIGSGVFADTYTVANILPTVVYILLIGGAINAVFVPQLVRHMKSDADEGEAYAQRLFSAVAAVLLVITVAAVVAAPWLVQLYGKDWSNHDLAVATAFARFLLPQIFFYGMFTIVSQVLNARGKFGAPMFAPVVNNIVIITTASLFLYVAGIGTTTRTVTDGEIALLGIGTTLGAALQALALWPALRASGLRLRLRTDLRGTGLGKAWTLARWTILLVLLNQVGTLVAIRLATGVNASTGADVGATVYANAFTIFMLPQSVITVSVVTALLPQLSGYAAEGRLDIVRERLGWALRTTSSLVIPMAASFVVLGIPIAVLLFRHGDFGSEAARTLGLTLSAFALGLPAFSAYYVLLRGFYALEDTRTPTFNALLLNGINIVLAWLAVALLPASQAIPGLGLAYAAAYWVALIALALRLRRRLNRLDGYLIVRTHVRVVLASLLAAAAMALGASLAVVVVGPVDEATTAAVVLAAGLIPGALAYLAGIKIFSISEAEAVVKMVLRRG